jgi:hypothetical protein
VIRQKLRKLGWNLPTATRLSRWCRISCFDLDKASVLLCQDKGLRFPLTENNGR